MGDSLTAEAARYPEATDIGEQNGACVPHRTMTPAASGPNFAGHYTLARWGCGAGCVTVAVIDMTTGAVQFPPFSIEDAWKADHIICHHGSAFQLTSG
jgi:hypothetical protein